MFPEEVADYKAPADDVATSKAQAVVLGSTDVPTVSAFMSAFEQQHYNPKVFIAAAGPDQGSSFTVPPMLASGPWFDVTLGPDANQLGVTTGHGDQIVATIPDCARANVLPRVPTRRLVMRVPRMPDAASRAGSTSSCCQSAAESTAAVVGFGPRPLMQHSRRRSPGAPAGRRRGRGPGQARPRRSMSRSTRAETNRGSVPGVRDPGGTTDRERCGVGGLVVQVPDHLDVVGHETDRHDDRRRGGRVRRDRVMTSLMSGSSQGIDGGPERDW